MRICMPSVVEYQFWYKKIGWISSEGEEVMDVKFFKMEECRGDKNYSVFQNCFTMSKIVFDFSKKYFI